MCVVRALAVSFWEVSWQRHQGRGRGLNAQHDAGIHQAREDIYHSRCAG